MNSSKNIQLATIYDKIESQLRALESLGVTTDKYAAMLYPLVESSLPEDLLRAWQRHSSLSNANIAVAQASIANDGTSNQSKDRLSLLIKFLENEVQNELRISMAVKGFDFNSDNSDNEKVKKSKPRFENKHIPSAAGLLSKNKNILCVLCNFDKHGSVNCKQAKNLSERQEFARKKRVCFDCLKVRHGFKQCRVYLKCEMCMCNDPEVFMQTFRVILRNRNKEINIRVVIDTGSQKSYMTKEAALRGSYEHVADQLMTHTLFGGEKIDTVSHKKYRVHFKSLDDSYACNFIALDQSVI